MKDELFAELLESVRQGGAILRGKRRPSRAFRFKEPNVRAVRKGYGLSLAETVPLSYGADIGLLEPKRPRRSPLASQDGPPLAHALQKLREQLGFHGYSVCTTRRRARLRSTVRSSASFLAKANSIRSWRLADARSR